MSTFFIAMLSIVISVAAQFALKAGMSSGGVMDALAQPFGTQTILTVLGNKFVLSGFFLYGVGAVVWLAVLSKWDVSKAYPLVGLGFALTVAIGFMAGEHVSVPRAIGVALISGGVFLVGRS